MDAKTAGTIIVAIGAGIALLGLVVLTGGLSWFGQLPGDIRVERGNARLYMPITSMLIVSVVLSLLLAVARRFI